MSTQELHDAAAQLHAGSSPQQLADLELALQGHFKAPSFAALGHGGSLLQCCADDPVMLQTLSLVSSTVPLSKVRACSVSLYHSLFMLQDLDILYHTCLSGCMRCLLLIMFPIGCTYDAAVLLLQHLIWTSTVSVEVVV